MISLKKVLYKLATKCPYDVGDIYMTTQSHTLESLQAKWPSTNWEQITDDAYLKIVSSDAGSTGGQSDHKIATTNLPSHSHTISHTHGTGNTTYTYFCVANTSSKWESGNALSGDAERYLIGSSASTQFTGRTATAGPSSGSSGLTGDGSAYYPGYLGVYLWKRIA